MHSVTSNAVANMVSKVETWSNDGIELYKIGKIVYGLFLRQISGSSPFTMSDSVPWKPLAVVRVAFFKNNNDTYAGQFIITTTGVVQCYLGGGSFLGGDYCCSFCYMTND